LTVGENGSVIADPHNALELADALMDMLNREKLPARKASAVRAGSQWTFDRHYSDLLKAFEEVIEKKCTSPDHSSGN
jgi:hypothetical protein